MNISKKALALFTGGAVAVGGVVSIGAQAFAQTPTVPTVSATAGVTGLETSALEAPGGLDVQAGHQDAAGGTGSDAIEAKGSEAKDAPEAPGAPDIQSGHQDAVGVDSTSAQ